ncbi:MAG: hypothetical protein KC472_04275 [Dehalococcoidia bacterium]|nr:hypothetical protein [Dehalococcoidia bacterium]
MDVTVLPNQRRPGVGRFPAAENRRAALPQQARFCPVVEDASKSGFLVYPPLLPEEALQIRYLEAGKMRVSLHRTLSGASTPQPVWVMDITTSAGTGGLDAYDVKYVDESVGLDAMEVQRFSDALIANVNAPQGGVGLRGAYDFVTPEGWDTVYTGILNRTERPSLPILTARVETDWYSQPTEFRYVLAPGEVLSANGQSPIGQVLFVPREPVRLREGTEDERQGFLERQQAYWAERSTKERATNFGTLYSYHYRDEQKARRAPEASPSGDEPGAEAPGREAVRD